MAQLVPYAAGVVGRYAARNAASGLLKAGKYAWKNKGHIAAGYESAKAIVQAVKNRKRKTSAVTSGLDKRMKTSAATARANLAGFNATKGRRAGKRRTKGFRKPLKKKYDNNYKFLQYGFLTSTEVTGSVNDPDCVYLAFQSYPQRHLVEVAVAAMLRKLFKKGAEWNCTALNERIPGYNGWISNGDGWKIELYLEDKATGTVNTYSYETATDETIELITGNYGNSVAARANLIMDALFNYSAGFGPGSNAANTFEPFKIRLFGRDGNVTSFWHHRADLNLRCEKLHYKSYVKVRTQNRTVSDAATNLTNDITCNPIGGKVFKFSNAVPKLKVDGAWQLETINSKFGVNLQRAATMALAVQRTTPLKAIWKNCESADPIHMNPGEMKETNLYHQGSMSFNSFLRKLHVGEQTNQTVNSGIGKSMMLCLEDDLNFARVQKVLVVYELMRRVGVWFETTKSTPSQGGFTQLTVSNVTA